MMCYASRTGTRRNLAALRAAGWGLLVSRTGVWRTEGFDNYMLDNGAWTDYQTGKEFDDDAFERLIDKLGPGAAMIVLPDIVAGGIASLEMSLRWLNRCLSTCPLVLLAVQDGMTEVDISPFVGPSVGVFLGGSTEWKISTMARWGAFCRARGIHFHVARVNSVKRMAMAVAAGADSVDGSSCSRYAVTVTKLTNGSRQLDMWTPERGEARP